MDSLTIGRELRARRTAAGRTVASVAADAGLSVPYIANLENGRGNPTTTALTRLAEALGMRLAVTLVPGEAVPGEAPAPASAPAPAVPASLVRLGRTARFRQAATVMSAALERDAGEFSGELVAALALLGQAMGRELAEADWWRLLDALLLIAAHPATSLPLPQVQLPQVKAEAGKAGSRVDSLMIPPFCGKPGSGKAWPTLPAIPGRPDAPPLPVELNRRHPERGQDHMEIMWRWREYDVIPGRWKGLVNGQRVMPAARAAVIAGAGYCRGRNGGAVRIRPGCCPCWPRTGSRSPAPVCTARIRTGSPDHLLASAPRSCGDPMEMAWRPGENESGFTGND